MSNKNEVFEYLIDQLRQQVNSNPYKQQCEDLAHEVLSLKDQLRDASELVDELLGTITLMNGKSGCRKWNARECCHNWRFVNGKAPAVCINCGVTKHEECEHEWFRHLDKDYCFKCGVTKPEECEHEWVEFHGLVIAPEDPRNEPGCLFCRKCGLKEYARKCEHEWSYVMGDGPGIYECDACGAQSKTLPYDLRWLA